MNSFRLLMKIIQANLILFFMEKVIKNLGKVIFIISLLLVPIFFIGLLEAWSAKILNIFWLVGALGYLGIISFSYLSINKPKFFIPLLVSAAIFSAIIFFDSNTAKSNNDKLCIELRNDPTCIEDECAFHCKNEIISSSICRDKNVELCRQKTLNLIQIKK